MLDRPVDFFNRFLRHLFSFVPAATLLTYDVRTPVLSSSAMPDTQAWQGFVTLNFGLERSCPLYLEGVYASI